MPLSRAQRLLPWIHSAVVGIAAGAAYLDQASIPRGDRLAVIIAVVVAASRGIGWVLGQAPAAPRRRRPVREEIADVQAQAETIAARLHKLSNDVAALLGTIELIEDKLDRGER